MGLETAALVAFTALRAANAYNQGEAQAEAIAQRGTLEAKNKARETVYRSAQLRQSFLSSGLTMEGTPLSVINETLNTGQQDVMQIVTNSNRSSKNAVAKGRSDALGIIGQSFGMASMSGMFEGIGAGTPESLGSFNGLPSPSSYGLTSAQGPGFVAPNDWGITGTGGIY